MRSSGPPRAPRSLPGQSSPSGPFKTVARFAATLVPAATDPTRRGRLPRRAGAKDPRTPVTADRACRAPGLPPEPLTARGDLPLHAHFVRGAQLRAIPRCAFGSLPVSWRPRTQDSTAECSRSFDESDLRHLSGCLEHRIASRGRSIISPMIVVWTLAVQPRATRLPDRRNVDCRICWRWRSSHIAVGRRTLYFASAPWRHSSSIVSPKRTGPGCTTRA